MGDEKKDDVAGDPFKLLLEESLAQQRNKMIQFVMNGTIWVSRKIEVQTEGCMNTSLKSYESEGGNEGMVSHIQKID
jgi:hypothetical protein